MKAVKGWADLSSWEVLTEHEYRRSEGGLLAKLTRYASYWRCTVFLVTAQDVDDRPFPLRDGDDRLFTQGGLGTSEAAAEQVAWFVRKLDEARPRPTIADVATAQIRELAQGDLTSLRTIRQLRQRLDLLPKVLQVFESLTPADEEKEMLRQHAEEHGTGSIGANNGGYVLGSSLFGQAVDALPGSLGTTDEDDADGMPRRNQGANPVETFQSRIMRESLSALTKMTDTLKDQADAMSKRARIGALDGMLQARQAGAADIEEAYAAVAGLGPNKVRVFTTEREPNEVQPLGPYIGPRKKCPMCKGSKIVPGTGEFSAEPCTECDEEGMVPEAAGAHLL